MQKFTLEGKTILVTGASSGIGRGVAIACSECGARCILVARNSERLREVRDVCCGEGHTIETVDFSSVDEIRSLVERLPPLDGMVYCAGVNDNHTPLKFITPDFFDRLVSVNVRAPVLFLSMLDKKKKLNKAASVVMISSISSFYAAPAHSLYCMTKGALTSFVRAAALDLAGRKVRVNSVAPGRVNTPMIDFSSLTEEQRLADIQRYPLKRYGESEDVAAVVVFLLSDAASWVTGQQYVVDGGVTIR